jgi:hypothetical protein
MGKEKTHISLVVIGHVDAGECDNCWRERNVNRSSVTPFRLVAGGQCMQTFSKCARPGFVSLSDSIQYLYL